MSESDFSDGVNGNEADPNPISPSAPDSWAGTLHCPACDYNLKGVCSKQSPVGQCPECGRAFNREELIRDAAAADNPRPWPKLLLFIWPALAGGILLWGLMANSQAVVYLALLVGFVTVGQSIYTGRLISRRVLRMRAVQPPSVNSVLSTIFIATLFTAMQIAIFVAVFFTGCVCAANTMSF